MVKTKNNRNKILKKKTSVKKSIIDSVGKKKLTDLNETERDILRVVSVLGGETMPVGSYRYKDHLYPGDIDFCEVITEYGRPSEVKNIIMDRILTTIRRILIHNPKIFISDFKAGEDKRFKYLNLDWSSESNKKRIKKKLQLLDKEKGIQIDKKLFDIIDKKVLTKEDISEFNDIIHEYVVIRWDIDKLLDKKIYKNGKYFKLEDALTSKTNVKFDILYFDKNKYIEVTNYLIICSKFKTTENKLHTEFLTTEMGNLVETLLYDINKYYESGNYLKCLKRVWSLINNMQDICKKCKKDKLNSNLRKNRNMIKDIFGETPAKISQIKADLEVIEVMGTKFEKTSKMKLFPADNILYTLLDIKNKFGDMRVCEMNNNNDGAKKSNIIDAEYKNIIKLFDFTDKYRANSKNITASIENYWHNRKNVKEFLNDINKYIPEIISKINETVNIKSKEWLKENGINLERIIANLQKTSKELKYALLADGMQ